MTYSPSFFNKESKGSSRQTITNFQNGSGSTLDKATLVSVNTSSQLVPTSVSSETLVQAIVGMTNISIPNAATGSVADFGRLEDITTSFAVGDAVYLNKDGTLTNTKPQIGINSFTDGDFVIFIGVVVKNEFNVSLKDLKLMISVIGQL
ncbi:MAG: hypothetical protein HC840_00840 [Leptolyngbyaceae cyanobacterium RM2_2_4]|nr:hypothetical protein [Leptolyngbyaceae cyanobacterium RM2_2_4]